MDATKEKQRHDKYPASVAVSLPKYSSTQNALITMSATTYNRCRQAPTQDFIHIQYIDLAPTLGGTHKSYIYLLKEPVYRLLIALHAGNAPTPASTYHAIEPSKSIWQKEPSDGYLLIERAIRWLTHTALPNQTRRTYQVCQSPPFHFTNFITTITSL